MFKVGDVLLAKDSAYWNTVLLVIDASNVTFYRLVVLDNLQHINVGEIFYMQKCVIHKEYECLR
jgi:hypothetical protein